MIERVSVIQILKVAAPFVIAGIALSAAEVAITSWPFWAMLVALVAAAYTDFNDIKVIDNETN